MTIRSRLLRLLLPPLIAFVTLISLFVYYHWNHEIFNSFSAHLKTVVVSSAQNIQAQDVQWLDSHRKDTDILDEETYLRIHKLLHQIKIALPITNLYIVKIIPSSDKEETSKTTPFYQEFLLDASSTVEAQKNNPHPPFTYLPGDIDFSETDEQRVYNTKMPYVTPIYEAMRTKEKFISAYAPILDESGKVSALIAADMNLESIDQKLKNAIAFILISALATILFVTLCVFFTSDKISKPVQKLKDAALEIAAGDYGHTVEIPSGPLEIKELANTLNTMSECLEEHIYRLKETSVARERLLGEQECANMLRYVMFQEAIQEYNHPKMDIKVAQTISNDLPLGFMISLQEKANEVGIVIQESDEKGFKSMFKLLKSNRESKDIQAGKHIEIGLNFAEQSVISSCYHMPQPFLWSHVKQTLSKLDSNMKTSLEPNDIILLYNVGLIELFESVEEMVSWLNKVLRHFSAEDLELLISLLQNEISYLSQKYSYTKDAFLLCIKLKPESLQNSGRELLLEQ